MKMMSKDVERTVLSLGKVSTSVTQWEVKVWAERVIRLLFDSNFQFSDGNSSDEEDARIHDYHGEDEVDSEEVATQAWVVTYPVV